MIIDLKGKEGGELERNGIGCIGIVDGIVDG